MPSTAALEPAVPVGGGRRHRRRLGRRRPGAAAHDVQPAGADPHLRGVRPRARRRRAGPRPGALQHRPGGRRRRLGARAHQRRHRQRLAPRAPPVPRQGAAPRRAQGHRPDRAALRRRPRGAAAHAGRDLRTGPRLQPRPRRLDAPAVAGGRRDRHQRDRRRRCPAGRRLRVGAPAGRHRRGGGDLLRRRRGQHRLDAGDVQPGRGVAAAALLLHREQPVRRVHHASHEATGEPRLSARGPGFGIAELEGRRDGPARRPPGDAGGRSRTCGPATGPTVVEADVYRYFHQNGAFPGSAFGYRTKEEETRVAGPRPDRPGAPATSSAAASSTPGRARRRSSRRPRR